LELQQVAQTYTFLTSLGTVGSLSKIGLRKRLIFELKLSGMGNLES
jgi:hypothetical protein